jgi:hypothetical protein
LRAPRKKIDALQGSPSSRSQAPAWERVWAARPCVGIKAEPEEFASFQEGAWEPCNKFF